MKVCKKCKNDQILEKLNENDSCCSICGGKYFSRSKMDTEKISRKEYKRINKLIWRVSKYKSQSKVGKYTNLLGWTKADFLTKFGEIPDFHHIDHKIPISWFNKEAPVSIINNLENLQLLNRRENLSKNNRYANTVSEKFIILAKPHLKPEYQQIYEKFIFRSYPYNKEVKIHYL